MQPISALLGLVAALAAGVSLVAQVPSGQEFGAKGGGGEEHRAWLEGAKQAQLTSRPWLDFLAEQAGTSGGDGWVSHWTPATGTPRAIFGPGLPIQDWRENTLAEARRHATALLGERGGLLGLGTSEFRETIASRIGRQWSFVYEQYFRGLPVIGGRADVRVHMVGKVSMFGASAWPIPAEFDVTPAIGPEVATAAAWTALGELPTGVRQPAKTAAPRLVVWGDIGATTRAPFSLAWEVSISNVSADGSGAIGRYYVDARTGQVLRFESDKHECGLLGCGGVREHAAAVEAAAAGSLAAPAALPVNTTVTVMGWTRVGIDGYGAATNVPIPGLEVNVPGIGTMVTDQNGQFTINIAAPVSISVGTLNGRHHGNISGSSAPSASVTVQPGVAATLQIFTSAVTVPQASHTSVSYWVDGSNEFARAILGNSPELATADNVTAQVNIASTCNAYYTNNTINFYNAGGGCSNTANATVIAHEWGHGLDERYGGISQTNGLSEGWGDILGMYLVDSPNLGQGFQTSGVPLRSGNNTTQYPCSGCGVHTAGQSWMGFAWKLRERMATTFGNRPAAIAVTNDIVVGTIAADAIDQQGAVLEVFLADDDDGNLSNGTPNVADLTYACQQHSLPIPTGGGGGGGPANDDCANAIVVTAGVQGPFTNVGANTSSSWPCANGGSDVWFVYNAGSSGTLTVSTCGQAAFDTAIEVLSGSCGALTSLGCNDDTCSLQSTVSVPVTPGNYYIRVGGYAAATGTFSLDITGPAGGTPASSTPFGVGCYRQSSAFYETFASAGFDLSGGAMRMLYTGTGYAVVAGGTYVAPTAGATQLSLSDDGQATVTLGGALPFVGGSTSSLVVCSNGFVSVATGNGTGYTPSATAWLASGLHRWGTWHDFNPAATGSGKVKFEQVGSVAYVTWDGVYSYGQTQPNTWQIQFDLSNGNVTSVWSNVTSSGNAWLVGYAGAAPNNDLGSMDLSAALPGGFVVGQNLDGLSLSGTLPQLGSTMTLTTIGYPAGVAVAFQVISLVDHDPGIDMTPAGMPGCFRFTDTEAVVVRFVAGGQTAYAMTLPSSTAYMGLPLNSQTWGISPGANTLGMINSNGLRMVVGY
ncbi:MAG: hypothetical protein RL398_3388 [Planctomycetota bacterium]